MNRSVNAPIRVILLVIACVCFGFAAFAWPAAVEPYRSKLIGAGLLCWCASTFFD
jgi:hypothetical protein